MLSTGLSYSRPIQERYEEDERWLRTRRRHRILSGLCTILALMIAGAAWYAYPILKRQDSSLAQLVPTASAGRGRNKEKGQAGENLFHRVQAQIEHQIETIQGWRPWSRRVTPIKLKLPHCRGSGDWPISRVRSNLLGRNVQPQELVRTVSTVVVSGFFRRVT